MRLTVKSVIQAECCNHYMDGPYEMRHYCCWKDRVCPIFTDEFRRCGWFEEAVMPAWMDVAAEYADMCGQRSQEEITVTRLAICRNCGESFKAIHNRQQYCSEECAKLGERGKAKERQRRKRQPSAAAV